MRTILLSIIITLPSFAAYSAHRSITIDHTKVASDQTNFPVMICANTINPCDSGAHANLSIPNLKTVGNGGLVTDADGDDIVLTSDSGCSTLLDFQHEPNTYVASTGVFIAHVRIGSLSSSVDTVIYLCYGNASITTDQSTTATWNSAIERVFHMAVAVTGLTPLPDATANAGDTNNQFGDSADLTSVSGDVNGAINNANGSGYASSIVTGIPTGGAFSLSNWAKSTNTANSVSISYGVGGGGGFNEVYIDLNGNGAGKWTVGDVSAFRATTSGNTYNDGNWHHVVATYDGSSTSKIYVDGSLGGTGGALTQAGSPDQVAIFGLQNDLANAFRFKGAIDEARIYSVELTADWITTEYNNQSAPHDFYTFGSEVGSATTPHRVISQ